MRTIGRERPLLPAAALWCLGSLSVCFALRGAAYWGVGAFDAVASWCPLPGLALRAILVVNPVFLLVFGWLLFIVCWLIRTAVLHLVAELLGGTGRALSLLAALGYARVPLILSAPLTVALAAAGGWSLATSWPGTVWRVGAVAVCGWTVGLLIVALQETHGLTTRKAVSVLLAIVAAVVLLHVLAWLGCVASGFHFADLLAVD